MMHMHRGAQRDQRVLHPSIIFNPQIGCCGNLKPLLIYSKCTTKNNKEAVRMYVSGRNQVPWVSPDISPMTREYSRGLASRLSY